MADFPASGVGFQECNSAFFVFGPPKSLKKPLNQFLPFFFGFRSVVGVVVVSLSRRREKS